MLCFSNGMCFIRLTPLFPECLCAIVHFCDKGCAEFLIPWITAQDHLAVQFSQCRKEPGTISFPNLAEDNDIWLIRMLEFISETDRYLMLNEQLIGIIFWHINECVMVIQQGESFKCKIESLSASIRATSCSSYALQSNRST